MEIISLILMCAVFILTGLRAQCPSQCRCHDYSFRYEVICPESPNVFPDLSALAQVSTPIRLELHLHPSRTLSQSDFPFNSTISILLIKSKGKSSLESDALIRLAHSLLLLSIENAGLQFTNQMTFLKGLTNLIKLVLSDNQQADGVLHQACFTDLNLISLAYIELVNCNLTYIHQFPFDSLEELRVINLESNTLKRVNSAFDYIAYLTRVNLGNNSIKIVQKYNFRGLDGLATVILNDNEHLIFESNCFTELSFVLKELLLRNCDLDDVPACILNFTRLKKLDLADNPLTSLTADSLAGEMCLEELDVSGTNFSLSATVFSAQRNCLRILSLNSRHLTAVPTETLENLPNLTTINLRKNKIKTVSANSFRGFPITNLDLSENPLTNIDGNLFKTFGFHLSLGLERTKVKDMEFVLHYERGKFSIIDLIGTDIPCGCNLYKIMYALPEDTLYGYCVDGLKKILFIEEQSKSYLENNYKCDIAGVWSLWRQEWSSLCDSHCFKSANYTRYCLKPGTCSGEKHKLDRIMCWESCSYVTRRTTKTVTDLTTVAAVSADQKETQPDLTTVAAVSADQKQAQPAKEDDSRNAIFGIPVGIVVVGTVVIVVFALVVALAVRRSAKWNKGDNDDDDADDNNNDSVSNPAIGLKSAKLTQDSNRHNKFGIENPAFDSPDKH